MQTQDLLNDQSIKTTMNIANMLTSILEDPEMTNQFVIDYDVEPQHKQESNQKNIQYDERMSQNSVGNEKNNQKQFVTRLDKEIKKNNFNITPIPAQIFLLLIEAHLQGKNNVQKGKLMMTNYRIVFFRERMKRVDVPYGLISAYQYQDKLSKIIFKLKYPHLWRFKISQSLEYQELKNFIEIYFKSNQLQNSFAFQYALKVSPIAQSYHFDLKNEYQKLNFHKNPRQSSPFINQNYEVCPTYPSLVYISNYRETIMQIASHRKNKRFPILAYSYQNLHSKLLIPVWISSSYEDAKNIDKKAERELLKSLGCSLGLQIFVAESKQHKSLDETNFEKDISVNYLKLQTNLQTSLAFKRQFEVFLMNKKPFIQEVLNSKWYDYIQNILRSCQIVRNMIVKEYAVLIRCQNGWDKSLLLASLVQIILDPYFRTFKGFESLVMRMFVQGGHPFAERLGSRMTQKQICPLFLQFLDCVTQLIYQNPQSFEYNFKYLSKVSNLMYTNIYGTFLCNSAKEYQLNKIEIETVSIWKDLKSPITANGFYNKKGGILQIQPSMNSIRIWKQYFGSIVSKSRDHYRFQQIAEDNEDYLNLYCLKVKQQNTTLMQKMKLKMAQIQRLQQRLKQQ